MNYDIGYIFYSFECVHRWFCVILNNYARLYWPRIIYHDLKVFDATKWYLYLAMTVLPLNSIINPLIYEKSLTGFLGKVFREILKFFRFGTSTPELWQQSQLWFWWGSETESCQRADSNHIWNLLVLGYRKNVELISELMIEYDETSVDRRN